MLKKFYLALSIIVLNIATIAWAAPIEEANDLVDDDKYNYNYTQISNKCEIYDPYENINRKIFTFNGVLDAFTLRPIAKIYGRFTPNKLQNRVDSFLSNVREPLTTVNYTLQGKGKTAARSLWRFLVNSTFGLAGLFDVASKLDVRVEHQTFANTLGHYGVGPGPYIVLPIYGGMGARSVMDPLALNSSLNPLKYATHKDFDRIEAGIRLVHQRHKVMPFTDHISQNSLDPYIAMRNAIMQESENRMDYPEHFTCPAVRNHTE